MEQSCSYHISNECVIYVRDVVKDVIQEVTKEAVVEFDGLNECRERQGLRRLKRLNAWSIGKAVEKVLKDLNHQDMGSQPAMIGSLGGRMSADSEATKSAKAIDDFREVV